MTRAIYPPGGVYFSSFGFVVGIVGFGGGGGCRYCFSVCVNCFVVGLSWGSRLVACSTSFLSVGFVMFLEYGFPVSISASIIPRL